MSEHGIRDLYEKVSRMDFGKSYLDLSEDQAEMVRRKARHRRDDFGQGLPGWGR